MSDNEIVVYISNDSSHCDRLITKLNEWEVDFQTKNVSENREYMKELQDKGVFGTPATIVGNEMILGSQINKIKYSLGLAANYSYYNSFHERYSN
ncbi:glutaredoxin family protein [Virgibacillus doumboii]|uniref:glutaredoxin family protein n=1 Tax=Virgibacillus doumboii TaxID=2697503 RepID=UPI0013E0CB6E|nr:glutaredoxin family protein [Virgibacillus doumboii]